MMNTDIRIDVNLWTNLKILRLSGDLGERGVLSLLRLWTWTAIHRPSGKLEGMSSCDIGVASGFVPSSSEGEDNETFYLELVKLGFLDWDAEENCPVVHDWETFQTWASQVEEREAKGRYAALAKYNPAAFKQAKAAGKRSLSIEEYVEYMRLGCYEYPQSSAPNPNPNPNPNPAPKRSRGTAAPPGPPKPSKAQRTLTTEDFRRELKKDPFYGATKDIQGGNTT